MLFQVGILSSIIVLIELNIPKGLGHACGHNVIASAGAGAAIGLAEFFKLDSTKQRLPPIKANLVVIGTPAEEGGGVSRGTLMNIDERSVDRLIACFLIRERSSC